MGVNIGHEDEFLILVVSLQFSKRKLKRRKMKRFFGTCVRFIAYAGAMVTAMVALHLATNGWLGAWVLFVASAAGATFLMINFSNYVVQ